MVQLLKCHLSYTHPISELLHSSHSSVTNFLLRAFLEVLVMAQGIGFLPAPTDVDIQEMNQQMGVLLLSSLTFKLKNKCKVLKIQLNFSTNFLKYSCSVKQRKVGSSMNEMKLGAE